MSSTDYDGFDPADSRTDSDDYDKFRVRYKYEFYKNEADLQEFEMDLAGYVAGDVLDGCTRRRLVRTGVGRGLGSEDILGLDSDPPDTVGTYPSSWFCSFALRLLQTLFSLR